MGLVEFIARVGASLELVVANLSTTCRWSVERDRLATKSEAITTG